MIIEEVRIRALRTYARSAYRTELMLNLVLGEFIRLSPFSLTNATHRGTALRRTYSQTILSLMPYDVFVKGVHKEVSIAGADGAITA
jgi:hypothetical protein